MPSSTLLHTPHQGIGRSFGEPGALFALTPSWAALTAAAVLLAVAIGVLRWRRAREFEQVLPRAPGAPGTPAGGPQTGSGPRSEPGDTEPPSADTPPEVLDLDVLATAPPAELGPGRAESSAAEAVPEPPPPDPLPAGADLAVVDASDLAGVPVVIDLSDDAGSANGDSPASELGRLMEEHRRSTAELAGWVVSSVVSESELARARLEACRHEASAALRRASELAESIVVAGGRRGDELMAAAAVHDAEAARRHEEAQTLLTEAREKADELLAAAEAAAGQLRDAAAAQEERSRAILAAAESERAEIIGRVRAELGEVLRALEERIEATDEITQGTVQTLLSFAIEERQRWMRGLAQPSPDAESSHRHGGDGGNGVAGGGVTESSPLSIPPA
jgi:hypothetical protein